MEPFPSLSSFTFGCMSLGSSPEKLKESVRVARAAMESGIWFHSSQEYSAGGAFMVMRHAFDEDRAHVPKLILKIRCDNAAVLKFDVEDALRRLKVERVDLAQLCRSKHDRRPVVDDFLAKGEMWEVCQNLQKEGKAGPFILEVFASFSPDALRAVKADLFPAYIFYISPGERQASNELFRLWLQKNQRLLSLRTMCGGLMDPARCQELRDREPQDPALAKFAALKPIRERSGCASWPEFSMSFLKSIPNLLTTIAGTSKMENLKMLLDADAKATSMDQALAAEILALHDEWRAHDGG